MKRILISVLLVALALGLMAFQPAGALSDGLQSAGLQSVGLQSTPCSSVVTGGSCVLQSDETLDSDLLVMGGSAVLEEGSKVKGDVAILGGSLVANGDISGDINLIGGNVSLGSHAVVGGDVNTVGGNLSKEDGAVIKGSYNANVATPFSFFFPGRLQLPNWNEGQSVNPNGWNPVASGLGLIGTFAWWMFRSLLWAILALLVVLVAPRNTERIAAEVSARPVESGGLGCLTVIVAVIVLGLLAITICGLPITLIGAVVLIVAWSVGIIALGYELGKRLVAMLKQDWAPPVVAALGTGVLTLVTNGIGLVWCVGWLAPAVVGSIGLGAVLLTRFGLENPRGPAALAGGPLPPVYPAGPVDVYPAAGTQVIDEYPPVADVFDPRTSDGPSNDEPSL